MTSISGSTSPLARMQASLSSAISAGTIASSDQDALSSALTAIDKSMKSERSKGNPKEKIDGLIDAQVSAGSLTSDQASELKDLFASNAPKGGAGGPGGPGGAGGPPPPPPGDDSSTTDSSSSDGQVQQLLTNFLNQLKESLGTTGYGASGTTSSASRALVVDTNA